MKSVAFKAGDAIIREGEEGDTAFFIVSGSVEVLVGKGGRRVLALEAGEVFGEMSLIEPGPRSATIVAQGDVECLEMSYDEFIGSLEDNPQRAVAFMKTLVRRLRLMNQLMEKIDPNRKGLRDIVKDVQNAAPAAAGDSEAMNLSWTMLW